MSGTVLNCLQNSRIALSGDTLLTVFSSYSSWILTFSCFRQAPGQDDYGLQECCITPQCWVPGSLFIVKVKPLGNSQCWLLQDAVADRRLLEVQMARMTQIKRYQFGCQSNSRLCVLVKGKGRVENLGRKHIASVAQLSCSQIKTADNVKEAPTLHNGLTQQEL